MALLCLFAPALARASGPAGDRARVLFDRAQAAYASARYEEALATYADAYRARPLPGFLFDIGQCYRQLGRGEKALAFYRSYLERAPTARNREVVASLIVELEQHRAVGLSGSLASASSRLPSTAGSESESTPASDAVLAPTPQAAPERKPIARRWQLWVGVGAATVVLAGVGVGLGFGLSHGGFLER